jgi:ABC-type antimicrobial peptide transport system permease subunit
MIFIIGLIIGCVIGFCGCAFFAANKIAKLERIIIEMSKEE